MFEFDLSNNFRKVFKKLSKKNPAIAGAINRKIKEIIYRDRETINTYKNLSYGRSNLKRVHITSWLVMIFEVDIDDNFILFVNIAPRDDVYKRK